MKGLQNHLNNKLNQANSDKLNEIVNRIWREFDLQQMGALDKIEAFRFINIAMKEYLGNSGNQYTSDDFDSWFDKKDTCGAERLDKATILEYLHQ